MKKIVLFALVLCLSTGAIAQQVTRQELHGGWEFRQENLDDWMPAKVPGLVQTDLLENGKIKDPYYADNYLSIQWVDKVDWEYRTTFDAPQAAAAGNARLVFEGLDCFAKVWLNGTQIIEADNMFRTWKADVHRLLKPTGNTLHIVFESPTQRGLEFLTSFGLRLHGYNDHAGKGGIGNNKLQFFLRKPGYQFGWDLTPRILTVGIWRPVVLESWDEGRIEDLYVYTKSLEKNYSKAVVGSRMKTAVTEPGCYTLTLAFNGKTVQTIEKELISGEHLLDTEFEVKSPELWWPNGAGKPHLYDVSLTLSRDGRPIDTRATRVGIRTSEIRRVDDPDGKGTSFGLVINHKQIFCKGSNYVPCEVLLPRTPDTMLEHVVKSTADVNMNMLRVWGGGIYEEDYFYELCDRYGIMVWHDFMFACGMYPDTPAFYASVEAEARDNIERLRNHPSVVLWCGNNEVEVPWNPYGNGWQKSKWQHWYNPQQIARLTKGMEDLFYDLLDRCVRESCADGVPYWPSSPLPGYKIGAESPYTQGDYHYWQVWHNPHNPVEYYNTHVGRFMSEYGLIGFPELASMKRYTPEKDLWLHSPTMEAHQGSPKGNDNVIHYVGNHFRKPTDFAQQIYVSQIMQAEGITIAMEAHRRNMPWCQGSLIWQVNDCWPCNSWAGIDFYGYWKAMHYAMKQACAPILVAPYLHGDTLDLFIVSDLYKRVKGTLELTLMDFSGKKLKTQQIGTTLAPATSTKVASFPTMEFLGGADKASTLLFCKFISADGEASNILYFDLVKNLSLSAPKVDFVVKEADGEKATIVVSTDSLAKNVMVMYDGEAGRFSDNFFDLLPGQSREITVATDRPADEVLQKLTYMTMDRVK